MGKCLPSIPYHLRPFGPVDHIHFPKLIGLNEILILQVKYCPPYKRDEGFPNVKVLQVEWRLLKEKDVAKNWKERNLEEIVISIMCLITIVVITDFPKPFEIQ